MSEHEFELFGKLNTWIVGVQYYRDAKRSVGQQVFFEIEPENPVDSNAVVVMDRDGEKIGYLPHYDAAHFAPLTTNGSIALKGFIGEETFSCRSGRDRLPLSIEVYATRKIVEALLCDEDDDYRSIFHNLLAEVWKNFERYTANTLLEFRNKFRSIAHNEDLYPKTSFVYRLMKARIQERQDRELREWRDRVIDSVNALHAGSFLGWPQLALIPLYDSEPPERERLFAARRTDLTEISDLDITETKIPAQFAYPTNARGAITLINGAFYSIKYFAEREQAEVYWYPIVLDALDTCRRDPFLADYFDSPIITPDDALDRISKAVKEATDCSPQRSRLNPERFSVCLDSSFFTGKAEFVDEMLRAFSLKVAKRRDKAKKVETNKYEYDDTIEAEPVTPKRAEPYDAYPR